jgi:hypothetical protein
MSEENKALNSEEMRMEASDTLGTIHIKRESRWMGNLGSLRVFIDGREVGKLRNGEEAEFSTAPGTREVSMKAGRLVSTKRMNVEVQAGKTTHLVCMLVSGWVKQSIEAYQLSPPSQISSLDELEKLAALRDKGIITEEEFNAKKEQLLDL